jgi:hypothetical protein
MILEMSSLMSNSYFCILVQLRNGYFREQTSKVIQIINKESFKRNFRFMWLNNVRGISYFLYQWILIRGCSYHFGSRETGLRFEIHAVEKCRQILKQNLMKRCESG